jgi:hypothetical protein
MAMREQYLPVLSLRGVCLMTHQTYSNSHFIGIYWFEETGSAVHEFPGIAQ